MLHWESPQTVFSTVSCSQTCVWQTMITKSQWMGQSILMIWNHKTHLLAFPVTIGFKATHMEGVWSHSLLRMSLLHYSLTKQTVVSSHLVRMNVIYWAFKEHSKLLFHFISKPKVAFLVWIYSRIKHNQAVWLNIMTNATWLTFSDFLKHFVSESRLSRLNNCKLFVLTGM